MKAVISGYYGFDNTGDEAILGSIITQLKKFRPDIAVTVLSANPKKTSADHNVASIGRYSILRIMNEIRDSDVLISGGGGLLQDSTGKFSVLYYLGIMRLAKLLGKKFVVFAQGYGPVKSLLNKWLVRSILNSAALITLRDEASFKAIKKDGVTLPPAFVTADPVFLIEKKRAVEFFLEGRVLIENKPAIGVCVRKPVRGARNFKLNIAKALDEIADKFKVQAVFVPFHFPGDAEYCSEISLLMMTKPKIISKQYGPSETLNLISNFSFIIGMRLHSIILAASAEIPVLGIDYDPKIKAVINELDIPGIPCDFKVETFVSEFENAWNNRQKISESVKNKVSILKERALLNFTALFDYVDDLKEFYLFKTRINNISTDTAVLKAENMIKERKPSLIFTLNPEIITAAQKDKELEKTLNSADINVPDGIGVVAAARLHGVRLKERVTGIDLMIRLLGLAKEKQYKVFLLGSKPGIANDAAANLDGINIVGTHHGYFKDEFDEDVVGKIIAAEPDMLFVGLGSPRQEKWISKYYKEIGCPVNMVIGGSLDVLSGRAKRAPDMARKFGVEWLYRLVKEPARAKRQFNLIKFGWMAIKSGMFNLRDK